MCPTRRVEASSVPSSRGSYRVPHLLKSKIHRAAVTHCELHYEGSCAIDETCSTPPTSSRTSRSTSGTSTTASASSPTRSRAERGSGIISLNGSAARRAAVGDLIIIAAFGLVPEDAGGRTGRSWSSSTRRNRQMGARPVPMQHEGRPERAAPPALVP